MEKTEPAEGWKNPACVAMESLLQTALTTTSKEGFSVQKMKQGFLVYNCKVAYLISSPSASSKPVILLHCCELPSVTGVPQAKMGFKWHVWICYQQGFEHFPLKWTKGCPPCKPIIYFSYLSTFWVSFTAYEDVHYPHNVHNTLAFSFIFCHQAEITPSMMLKCFYFVWRVTFCKSKVFLTTQIHYKWELFLFVSLTSLPLDTKKSKNSHLSRI